MSQEQNYIDINRALWDQRTLHHINTDFYGLKDFKENDTNILNEIELSLLGDVRSKKILHLQCHFGMDSLSLSRLGASVTGVDFSEEAVASARKINEELGLDATFICCNIYDLPQYLDETFDIVFTSYGTIGWLPDMYAWAGIVTRYIKPGGTFVFAEFHPVVWMFDDDFKEVAYTYFQSEPIVEEVEGTYADRSAPIRKASVSWNHGLAEVLTPLLQHGLTLTAFHEYDYSPYDCFSNTIEIAKNQYRIKHLDDKIPMVYALSMKKV